MRFHCSKCDWVYETRTNSERLALWILQVHHFFNHGGKKPLVCTDGDI